MSQVIALVVGWRVERRLCANLLRSRCYLACGKGGRAIEPSYFALSFNDRLSATSRLARTGLDRTAGDTSTLRDTPWSRVRSPSRSILSKWYHTFDVDLIPTPRQT